MNPPSHPAPPRPRVGSTFYRAHGLGNDYLVMQGEGAIPAAEPSWPATPEAISRVCHRTEGLGSDGIMVVCGTESPFPLRAFNPDGSEFERSGNGLRIVAAWLSRVRGIEAGEILVRIAGDIVTMRVLGQEPSTGLFDITVEMGRARVGPGAVHLDPGALDAEGRLRLPGRPELPPLELVPVSTGNPHAVLWADRMEGIELARVGVGISTHPGFAEGTNVQRARVVERASAGGTLEIEIWERGAGPTSASGSSACAVAAAAVHEGRLAPGEVLVRMPGGALRVRVSTELDLLLRGPVQGVAEGRLDPGFVRTLG